MTVLLQDLPKHSHPATYSKQLHKTLVESLQLNTDRESMIDPFSGTGICHILAEEAGYSHSVGIELEPEWSNVDIFDREPRLQIVGDAVLVLQRLLQNRRRFSTVMTSPVYGNRMSDHHEARDTSKRNTYRHRLGRPLSTNNAGMMHFKPDSPYTHLHSQVWDLATQILKPNGLFVLNVKNFIRKGEEVDVTAWHVNKLEQLGLQEVKHFEVACPSNRHGANGSARVECEHVIVFAK